MIRAALAAALLLPARPLVAQHDAGQTPAVSEFVATVREATTRYRDRNVAITDGYRMIGPDIPSMGEHWLNVPMLLAGTVDPLHPPILEYAVIRGKLELVGVAYAALVDSGAPPPTGFPVGNDAWHFHAGTVNEESFILSHGHVVQASAPGPRVAVLHLWAWIENPAGVYATDNWALPWLRLGWPPPVAATEDAVGRAVALAAGGDNYFAAVITAMAHPDSLGRRAVRDVLARAKTDISATLGVGDSGAPPGTARLASAARQWEAAWDEALALVHHHK